MADPRLKSGSSFLYDEQTGDIIGVKDPDGSELLFLTAIGGALYLGNSPLLEWEDLTYPAQAINPAGSVSAPSVDNAETGFPGTLLFSGIQDNFVAVASLMPHSWLRGSAVRPHIHWAKPTGSAAAVSWELYYRVVGNPGSAVSAWVGPVAGTLLAGDPTQSDTHLVTGFGDVALPALKEGAVVMYRIYRRGTADADNTAVRLLEFDVHFQREKLGTLTEYPA